ncbi:MAG TPA: radical SAM protein [bacterium]|nr:radical SAM protein [bacterium]HOL48737.1 radical SAM protein [bacterium]HPQ19974.1 radical SAM protein [bacterium]
MKKISAYIIHYLGTQLNSGALQWLENSIVFEECLKSIISIFNKDNVTFVTKKEEQNYLLKKYADKYSINTMFFEEKFDIILILKEIIETTKAKYIFISPANTPIIPKEKIEEMNSIVEEKNSGAIISKNMFFLELFMGFIANKEFLKRIINNFITNSSEIQKFKSSEEYSHLFSQNYDSYYQLYYYLLYLSENSKDVINYEFKKPDYIDKTRSKYLDTGSYKFIFRKIKKIHEEPIENILEEYGKKITPAIANNYRIKGSVVNIEITNDCNLNCSICGRQIMKRKIGYMTDETFKNIINICNYLETPVFLNFSLFGEPFLHKNIFDFFDELEKRKIYYSIFTNGINVDEEKTERLLKYEYLSDINFHLIGGNENYYKKITNTDNYKKVVKNIRYFLEAKKKKGIIKKHPINSYNIGYLPIVAIRSILTKENSNEIIELLKEWPSLNSAILKANVKEINNVEKDFLQNNLPLEYTVIEGYNDYCGKLENLAVSNFTPNIRTICQQLYSSITILYDGTIVLCTQDINGENKIGNVNNIDIEDLVTYKSISEIENYHFENKFPDNILCKKCKIWYIPIK